MTIQQGSQHCSASTWGVGECPFESWWHWGSLPPVRTGYPPTHYGLYLCAWLVTRVLPHPNSLTSLERIARALRRAFRSGLNTEDPTLKCSLHLQLRLYVTIIVNLYFKNFGL